MKNYINELTRINGNWEQCIGITLAISEVGVPYLCHCMVYGWGLSYITFFGWLFHRITCEF